MSTVRSLLALDYERFEIIVVDDGSQDATSERVISAFNLRPIDADIKKAIPCQHEQLVCGGTVQSSNHHEITVTLIWKVNGRKADALNMGINAASYAYYVCVDADSILQSDALTKIVAPVMRDSSVVAVGGWVCPCNDLHFVDGKAQRYRLPRSPLACMQVLEYARSFLGLRVLFDKLNASLIISGAFGLFRKDMVVATGGYDVSTVGEDMEMVVRLHAYCLTNHIPYSVRYAINAVCWTQVPERIKDLYGQRRRWATGLAQCMRKYIHISECERPRYWGFNAVYGYFLLYELLSPFVELLGVALIMLKMQLCSLNVSGVLMSALYFAAFSLSFSVCVFFYHLGSFGFKVTRTDKAKAIFIGLFEVTVLHVCLLFVRASGVVASARSIQPWGYIKRQDIAV